MLKNFIFAIVCGFTSTTLITQCAVEGNKNSSTITQINPENLVCQSDIEQPVQEQIKSVCPENMVEVDGEYCTAVVHVCKVWTSEKKDRCAEYYPTSKCVGKLVPMRFCIDRFEAGNKEGEYVPRDISYLQAKDLCEARGTNLCPIEQWTMACEGPKRTPYSYGFIRSKETCNIDRNYIEPNFNAWKNDHQNELQRLDQSEPSGSRQNCKSAYGVYDMDSGLDEWAYDSSGHDDGGNGKEAHYKSALKGGYWGPVRNRCRPKTATHNEVHSYYQSSYRCCKNI